MYSSALKPFAFNTTDIEFLLAQVNFRPLFDAAGNAILNWDGTGAIFDARHRLIWDGTGMGAADAISAYGTSYQNGTDLSGLRDPSGMNNNLALVHASWGAVDQIFPRMAAADYSNYGNILSGGALGAYAANLNYWGKYSDGSATDGSATGAFNANGSQNSKIDYTISIGGAQVATDGTVISMTNIVDYTPRMISLLTTTAGVVYDTWANHIGESNPEGHQPNEIYYDANGVATVLDWGDLKLVADGGLGQVDTQARFEGSAGVGEQFIGGLNPGVSPSNSFFVTFGQFFDHGLDFIDKGGQGQTIKITFSETDPLYGMKGPDGQPVHEITMARATVQSFDAAGPQYTDHTSPFIDQSQTYGSHEQLTTLLREWVTDPATGQYHAGMNMLDGETLTTAWQNANGDMVHDTLPTLNELRAHVEATGRDALTWEDVLNLRNRDASGHVVAGNTESALILDSNPRFDDAHLFKGNAAQDSAVNAAIATLDAQVKAMFGANSTFEINATTHKLTLFMETLPPGSPPGTPHTLDGANAMYPFVNFANMNITLPEGAEHNAVGELLLASVGDHYIAGDGRVNENFGLTSIHHVFHEEHNFQVGNFIDALHREAISTNSFDNLHSFQVDMSASGGSIDPITHDYLNASGAVAWDLDKMFNAAKLVVEMEYQHAAVDQYARNVTPNIQEFVGYSPDKDPSVTLEYAQSIFRWGHSTLRETIDTIDPDHGLTGKIMGYALRDAFLNPDKYMDLGPASIILGMSHQQMNEVDEFVTPALNQGLLGQPLDLAAINIARGRDIGIPTLNDFREALGLARYSSWTEFGNNMQHPSSLVNFIAAYSFDGDLAAAQEVLDLVDGVISVGANGMTSAEAFAFLEGGDQGFNKIDTWIGGLAEIHQPGGLLGETFDLVFVTQIESLMDGDRFYYLYRLAGQQFAEEVGGGQLKDIVERNTGLTHLNGNIFGYADKYYDFGAKKEVTTDGTELQTTANNHKYGDVYATTHNADGSINFEATKVSDGALTLNPTLGIYTNTGRSSALDGTVVTINGKQYIRDTRLEDTGQDTGAALLNDGVNLDGTPNSGAESNEILVGTDRNDLIYANGGDDTVYGEDGDDIIFGGFGIDRLYGGDGSDKLYGGDNPDLMDGGSGDDFLYGESSGSDINGADQLIGGSGNDFVSGGVGIDKLSGGTGDDHVVGDGDTDPFTHGSDGNDWIEGNSGGDILYGDNGDDVIVGGADQDQMFGGNGDDIIKPGDLTGALTIGTDEVLGGDGVTDVDGNGKTGFDIIDFSDNAVRAGGVKFDLSNQTNPGVTVNGTPDQVQAFQMEGVIGSAGNDTLTGGSTDANDVVQNDWIIGGSGNDLLTSGDGNDIIVGGSVRLDELIGKYNSGYTHNNNNTGSTEAQQLEDARYQGASHRVLYSETIDNTGIIDAANALGGTQFEKHLTEMLRSDQFKNTALGDAAGLTVAGSDTAVLSGNSNDYAIERISYGTHNVVKLTDNVTHISKLVVDVANFQFGTGAAAKTYTFSQLVNKPTVSVGDVSVTEGNVGTTNANFVVALSQKYAHDVTVTYSTADGTAVAPGDYAAKSGTVVIPAGSLSATVAIVVNGDLLSEANETFSLNVSGATVAAVGGGTTSLTLSDGSGLGTILNDDQVNISVSSGAPVGEGHNGTTQMAFVVTLAQPTAATVTVNYTTSGGTATSSTDYAAASGTVTFNPGETSKTVLVNVNGDVAQESDETVTLTLSGNSSNSTILVSSATNKILNDDLIGTGGANTLAAPNNGITDGVTLNYHIDGLGGTDTLTGGAGNDFIDGGTGNDAMAGGTGNDIYVVDASGDTVTEAINAGTDTVNSSVTNTLGANIENLTLTGAANINGTGNALNNAITGNSGNNQLDGAGGTDTLIGLGGNDTYIVNNAGVTVVEAAVGGTDTVRASLNTYTLGAELENLVFTGAGDFVGTGNGLANSITGGTGNDTLDGGVGADTMIGGAGNDTYFVDNASDAVTETNGTTNGIDTVKTKLNSYTLGNNIENLTFNGTGDFAGTGNTGANTVTGGSGNDMLNGGTGADTLVGGLGNDTYMVENAGDVVTENSGEGTDAVQTTLGTYTLAANVENLSFTSAGNHNGTGNALGNAVTGNAGNDTLTGAGGNDSIDGAGGNDTAVYAGGLTNFAFGLNASGQITLTDLVADPNNEGSDTLAGIETVRLNGTNFAVTATGATGSQFVTGTNGADSLDGGAGNDIIVGGAGDDTITYNVNNGGTNNGGRDVIDGGSGTDTFVLVANNQSENFVIYTRAEAISAGFGTGLNAGTEIVVTRQQGAGAATVVAELKDIQEIKVQTSHLFTPQALAGSLVNAGSTGLTTNIASTVGNPADNVKVVGDFTQTTLAYNTITVDGTAGNTTVDISNLTSAHRIVFNTGGTGDTVVGTLRPQDVINGSVTGEAAAPSAEQPSTQPLHSFLSPEWRLIGNTGGLNDNRIAFYRVFDEAGSSASDATPASAISNAFSEYMGVELYQELAPLAGTVLQSTAMQMDQVPLQSSDEMWTPGHKYNAPDDWLSDDDKFSHFAHDLNGHFIP
jgi:Ca2+-binding RTX toxin-like protein